MEVENKFLPEARHQLTFLDPLFDPNSYVGKVVHCLTVAYDYLKAEIKVFIGGSFYGIIPLSELSIYDVEKVNHKFINKFFTNHKLLTAEIIGFDDSTKKFLLSRKKNMENALMYFSTFEGSSKTIFAYKTGATATCAFLDIGAGICGAIPYSEVSLSYANPSIYFDGTDYIPIHILFQNVPGKFIVSYKSTVDYQDFKVGDVVYGKVVRMLEDFSGLFIELTPNQSGILNTDYGLQMVHCDNKNWFIISDKNHDFPSRSVQENGKYYFSIKTVKNKNHFKLSLV